DGGRDETAAEAQRMSPSAAGEGGSAEAGALAGAGPAPRATHGGHDDAMEEEEEEEEAERDGPPAGNGAKNGVSSSAGVAAAEETAQRSAAAPLPRYRVSGGVLTEITAASEGEGMASPVREAGAAFPRSSNPGPGGLGGGGGGGAAAAATAANTNTTPQTAAHNKTEEAAATPTIEVPQPLHTYQKQPQHHRRGPPVSPQVVTANFVPGRSVVTSPYRPRQESGDLRLGGAGDDGDDAGEGAPSSTKRQASPSPS
ncbi:unnamed protein product, partial [Scytosiphon promiscuus]